MPAALASSPAFLSQRRFRALMDAFARPGTIQPLGGDLAPIGPVPPSAIAGLYALADFETTIHLAPSLAAQSELASAIRFETSARLVADPAAASFALLDARHDQLVLADFHQGTPEYPDRSTTIFVIVLGLADGTAHQATGPGIKTSARIAPSDLPADFLNQWNANRAGFPLGVDLVFCAGASILALPRSTRLAEEAR
jgi:alpha-D-ribose 1-methylphosphonate 5-triphosphate synthase subunit PhnH